MADWRESLNYGGLTAKYVTVHLLVPNESVHECELLKLSCTLWSDHGRSRINLCASKTILVGNVISMKCWSGLSQSCIWSLRWALLSANRFGFFSAWAVSQTFPHDTELFATISRIIWKEWSAIFGTEKLPLETFLIRGSRRSACVWLDSTDFPIGLFCSHLICYLYTLQNHRNQQITFFRYEMWGPTCTTAVLFWLDQRLALSIRKGQWPSYSTSKSAIFWKNTFECVQ